MPQGKLLKRSIYRERRSALLAPHVSSNRCQLGEGSLWRLCLWPVGYRVTHRPRPSEGHRDLSPAPGPWSPFSWAGAKAQPPPPSALTPGPLSLPLRHRSGSSVCGPLGSPFPGSPQAQLPGEWEGGARPRAAPPAEAPGLRPRPPMGAVCSPAEPGRGERPGVALCLLQAAAPSARRRTAPLALCPGLCKGAPESSMFMLRRTHGRPWDVSPTTNDKQPTSSLPPSIHCTSIRQAPPSAGQERTAQTHVRPHGVPVWGCRA